MADETRPKNRSVRIPDARWERFREEARRAGYDRTDAIDQFIRWYNRDPGARLPLRPGVTGEDRSGPDQDD